MSQTASPGDLLATSHFWNKLAHVPYGSADDERVERVLVSFIDTMKTANFSPFMVLGFLGEIADQRMIKSAADGAEAPGLLSSFTNWLAPKGGWLDKAKAWAGSEGAKQNVVVAETQKQHPTLHGLASSLFSNADGSSNDPALAKFYSDLSGKVPGHEQNVMGAVGSAWDALKSKPFIKEWAPAVVPGLATMAASRMAGAGWGTSALLGAGAGLLGHSAASSGLLKPIGINPPNPAPLAPPSIDDGVVGGLRQPKAPVTGPPAARPPLAAASNAPVGASPAPPAPPAQQVMTSNGNNAERIGKLPYSAPTD